MLLAFPIALVLAGGKALVLPRAETIVFPSPVALCPAVFEAGVRSRLEAVALSGLVALLPALIEPLTPTFREPFFAAGGEAALFGGSLRLSQRSGGGRVSRVAGFLGGVVAFGLNGRAEVVHERVDRPSQNFIKRHRFN